MAKSANNQPDLTLEERSIGDYEVVEFGLRHRFDFRSERREGRPMKRSIKEDLEHAG